MAGLNWAICVEFSLLSPSWAWVDRCHAIVAYARGYNLARMPFAVILAPEAVEDLKRLSANVRATARNALEKHLRNEPEKASRSRIKRLRGLRHPQYRSEWMRFGYFMTFPARSSKSWRS